MLPEVLLIRENLLKAMCQDSEIVRYYFSYSREKVIAGNKWLLYPRSVPQSGQNAAQDIDLVDFQPHTSEKPAQFRHQAFGLFRIGERNYTVFRKILWKNGMMIKSEEVGGSVSRTMKLDIATGNVFLRSEGREWQL